MKLLIALLLVMGVSTHASAGVIECVATNTADGIVANLKMDYERTGMTLIFDKPVSWSTTALEFSLVYSGYFGQDQLLVVTASAEGTLHRQNQMIEILFDGSQGSMKKGSLKAGDQSSSFRSLGKYRSYDLVCN